MITEWSIAMFLILIESILLIPIGILLIQIIRNHRDRRNFPDQSILTQVEVNQDKEDFGLSDQGRSMDQIEMFSVPFSAVYPND